MMASSSTGTWHIERMSLGDHACQFYRTAQDLSQTLIPYFRTGLANNQACVWVTAQPYPAERALSELRVAVPGIDGALASGQLQLYSYDEWYLKYARLGMDELVRVWLERKSHAVAAGYAGLRISGNGSFITRDAWPSFMAYERALNAVLRDQPIVTLCSYWLDTCTGDDVRDVMECHACGWSKHEARWESLASFIDGARQAIAVESCDVAQLMEESLHPYACRVRLEGDPIFLFKSQAANLRLIVAELAANAAKHGALAHPRGTVRIQWQVFINGTRLLRVRWTEAGMSHFVVPEEVGAGTHLLARVAENFERVFEPSGMSCTFELSLEQDVDI
jgi:hypothetical protein